MTRRPIIALAAAVCLATPGRITGWKLQYDRDHTAYESDSEDSSGDEIEVEINVDTGRVQIDD